MATNDPFDQEESSSSNPFARALKNGLVLSPIGLAGYVGYQKVHANGALNPIAAAKAASGPGRLGSTGLSLGRELKASAKISQERLLKSADTQIDALLESDGMAKLWSSIAEQRAVIQSLVETMDDPSAGLPSEFVLSKRQELVDIAQRGMADDEGKEMIKSVLKAMNDENSMASGARARFGSNLREFRKVGPQLAPPGQSMSAKDTFNSIDHGMLAPGSREHKNYLKLAQGLGKNGNRYIDLVTSGMGNSLQYYARVYSQGGARRSGSFLGTVPLNVGGDGAGAVNMRMNEGLTTGYRTNRMTIDLQAAAGVFKGHKAGSVTQGMLEAGGAMRRIEDFVAGEFLSKIESNGGKLKLRGGRSAHGAKMRQFYGTNPRLASSGDAFSAAAGMIENINNQGGFAHNAINVTGFGRMSRKEQESTMRHMAVVPEFDAGGVGGRMMSRGLEKESFGVMGVYRGSALEALQSTSLGRIRSAGQGSNVAGQRGMFPIISRIEQVVGREVMFVGDGKAGSLGRHGVFDAGATSTVISDKGTTKRTGKNVEWAERVTGGTNKVMVLDVLEGNKLFDSLAGSGAAYHQGTERIRGAFSKPLLDPGSKGSMSSMLLQHLQESGAEGELKPLSLKQIKEFGHFLGIGPNGMQRIGKDPRMTSMRVGYNITQVGDKKQVNLTGDTDRLMETFKGFSTLHKGTLQEVSNEAIERFLPAATQQTLTDLGVNRQHTVYGAGDMLKKGAGFFGLQMESGFGLVTGDKNYRSTLTELAQNSFGALGDSETGRLTGAVIQGLARSSASENEAGMVLAGIYNRGGKKEWLAGINVSQAVEKKDIEDAIHLAFGDRGQAVITAARRGVAIGATTMTHGAGVGDYNLGRGSVEPRFFSTMTHKLRGMGLDTKQTSDFLAGVYKNKIGYAEHLRSAGGMLKLAESVAGMTGPVAATNTIASGVSTLGLKDLQNMALDISANGFDQFMDQHPDGFMLDLSSDANTPANRAIASSATDVFKQGVINVPGREVLDAMRGATIKTVSGNKSIEDEYSRMMGNFIKNIAALSTNTDKAKAGAAESMSEFKDNVMGMTSKVIHGVTSGKVRGLQSQVAAIYDLDNTTNFSTPGKGELARNIFKKTKGRAVFQDSAGFMSQLNDFMGGDLSPGDAAKKAEMFFTTLERPGANAQHWTDKTAKSIGHKAKGVVSLAMRHPFAGLGNIATVQSFRHVEEIGKGADDAAFKAFVATPAGQKYADVGGFQNLVGGGKSGAARRKAFFKDFVGNLSEFSGEGGGRTFIPQQIDKIQTAGGGDLSVDFGISQAAVGDWDGDQWQMMMVGNKSGRDVMNTLGADNQWLKNESVYKIKSEMFTSEAKGGLKKHAIAGGMPDFAGVERIQHNIMQEYASKNLVGNLDVQMNKIRYAILDMSMEDPKRAAMADEAMSMLKVMQEHTVIKGKKLPVFREFAEMLTGSIQTMFEGKGDASFRDVLKTEVFVGSKLWKDQGGIQVTGVGSSASSTTQAAVTSMQGQPMVIDNTIDFLSEAVNRSLVTGVADTPSSGQLSMALGSGNPAEVERHFKAVRAAATGQAGVIAGFGDDIVQNAGATIEHAFAGIRSAVGNMDRKTQGLLAMGGMAALGVGALISNEGYGATPIVGDMETIGASTRGAIAAGSLLGQQGSQGPSPEQMQQSIDPYAMMGRPINTPTTYMNKGSSYQVRGEVNSGGGLGTINNYMNTLGGSGGSIRINDARRPITQNYLDRLSGDY